MPALNVSPHTAIRFPSSDPPAADRILSITRSRWRSLSSMVASSRSNENPAAAGGVQQRMHVLREAAAAPPWPGLQEVRRDAGIEAHYSRDVANIGADLVAQGCDRVDERDFRGQEGVRRVFAQFSGCVIGEHERRWNVEIQGRDFERHFARCGADHQPVGRKEVFDSPSFAKELRVRSHVNVVSIERLGQQRSGPNRHGGLGDDHRTRLEAFANDTGRVHDGAEVSFAVGALGRWQTQEHERCIGDRPFDIGRERDPFLGQSVLQQSFEPGFGDRTLAGLQPRDLVRIDVHADHLVAEFGHTCSGCQPDVAGADHGD